MRSRSRLAFVAIACAVLLAAGLAAYCSKPDPAIIGPSQAWDDLDR